jgi:hypothetical protein
MPLLALLLSWLLSACSDRQGPGGTTPPGASTSALGDSRVLSFRRTAVMDTVTAILEGKAVSLCSQHPVPATVHLVADKVSYQAVAAPDGTFRFFHVPAGNYMLTATHPAYRALAPYPVKLGTGNVAEVGLGVGCRAGKP